MHSGSDSTESQNYAQWALNPAAYQNMAANQVDWAALAQQWIIMKEAGPPMVVPPQVAPPVAVKEPAAREGGEAPMDVERGESPPNPEWGSNNWGWTPPAGPPPAPLSVKAPLLPTPAGFSQLGAPPDTTSDNATFAGYSTPNTGSSADYTTGYWTAPPGPPAPHNSAAVAAPKIAQTIKPHNRRFSKVNVVRPVQQQVAPPVSVNHSVLPAVPTIVADAPPQPASTLDAAKRKQLPAWIREGLEKMERDKMRRMEREKERMERDEYKEKVKRSEKETMEILKSTIIEQQQKSKFESDGENSEEEDEGGTPTPKKPVGHVEASVVISAQEQVMNVRRTMTEILLKVTNAEIETICREELQRHLKKQKASDSRRVGAPSGGANISAKLGLGIYGGGSDSSSGGESEEEESQDMGDSDSELRETIKRKKAEFLKTEQDIEKKLSENDPNNRRTDESPAAATNDNDTQVDAKRQGARQQQQQQQRSPSSSSTSSSSLSSDNGGGGTNNKRRRSSLSSRSTTPPSRRMSKSSRKSRTRSRSRSKAKKKDDHHHRRTRRDESHHQHQKQKNERSSKSSRNKTTATSTGRSSKRSRSRSSSYKKRSRSRSGRRGRRSRSRSAYSRRRRERERSRSSSSGRGKQKRSSRRR